MTQRLHLALSEFCQIVQGGRHKLSGNNFVDVGYPAYGAGGINGMLPTFEFDRRAVILSSIGARCGKCFLAERKWSSLANTQVILPDERRADAKFLWFQLNDEARWPRSGSAQPFIKPSDVKAHYVYLPPLLEQRRIAAILDQADALRVKRRAALARLDEMARAIFVEMFGDPASNPKGWTAAELGEVIVDGPQNGLYKPSSEYGRGTRILRIDSFYDGHVTSLNDLKRVQVSEAEGKIYSLKPDDIVINRVNSMEYLGKSALIPALNEPTLFESNMMRLAVDRARVEPGYVIQLLQMPFVKDQIRAAAKRAVNQASINQKDVAGFRLVCPDLDLQRLYVERIGKIDALKAQQQASSHHLDALFTSLQHRAFRGEL